MRVSLIDRLFQAGMIRFDQPPTPPGGSTPPTPTPPAEPPAEPRTFGQDDVTQIAAREHAKGEREGKRAATEEIAQRLGMSLEDAEILLKKAKEAEDANKSETERLLEEAKADRAAAQADRDAAAQERHLTARGRILTAAGVPEDAQDAINLPGISVSSTTEEIQAAVDALKEKVPALFGTTPPPPGDPGRPGSGARPPAGQFGQGGRDRFAKRFSTPAS